MGFSRQEYWSGFPLPSPGDLPNPGTEPASPALQAVSYIAGWFFTNWATWEAPFIPVCLCAKSLQSCPTLCNPMDYIAHQAPLSMGFPRQEYWSGLPFPTSGDLPNPGIEPLSPTSPALPDRFFTTSATWEAPIGTQIIVPHANIGIYFYILLLYYLHCFFKLWIFLSSLQLSGFT